MNRKVWHGELTWRRMKVLLNGLPPESAFARFVQNKSNRIAAEFNPERAK